MKIVDCFITAMPKSIFDAMPEVCVTFDDGSKKSLFSFYPDEIQFEPVEFIGLTEDQARLLRFKRDVRYIQS